MSNFSLKKYYIPIIIISLISLGLIAVFDKGLAAGLILLGFLTGITLLVLSKFGLKSKTLVFLLLIALLIHLGAVLFIHYADFQPFSGGTGGYRTCHLIATEISQNFRQGNFSFQGVPFYEIGDHPYCHYALVIGVIYTLTLPEMIIGQLFEVWLAVISVLLVYLIILEIGGSKKWAFLIGLIVSIYPSYLFYGSLLLKDALVTPLVLLGMFLCLKLIKNFLWKNFLIFYIVLAALLHFRFYIGYALLFTFILSWLLLSRLNLRKKIIYAVIIILLLGFLPKISLNQGFFGIDVFRSSFNQENISFYQEVAYSPPAKPPSSTQTPSSTKTLPFQDSTSIESTGFDSTWERKNSLQSFIYVLLGPLPWHMKYPRHLLALFETIPWFFLLFFIGKGIWEAIKVRNKFILPLLIFSLISLVVITIFINNFGIITRIRIPAFISLLCLIPFAFKKYEEK